MQCEDMAECLTDLMEGDLAEPEEAAALEHLASCSRCEAVLAKTRDAVELARDHGRAGLSDADRSRMFDCLSNVIKDSNDR